MGGTTDPAAGCVTNGIAVHEVPCHRRIEEHPVWAGVRGLRVRQGWWPADVPVRLWDDRLAVLTADGGFLILPMEAP